MRVVGAGVGRTGTCSLTPAIATQQSQRRIPGPGNRQDSVAKGEHGVWNQSRGSTSARRMS